MVLAFAVLGLFLCCPAVVPFKARCVCCFGVAKTVCSASAGPASLAVFSGPPPAVVSAGSLPALSDSSNDLLGSNTDAMKVA
jgi:hypothetical protein